MMVKIIVSHNYKLMILGNNVIIPKNTDSFASTCLPTTSTTINTLPPSSLSPLLTQFPPYPLPTPILYTLSTHPHPTHSHLPIFFVRRIFPPLLCLSFPPTIFLHTISLQTVRPKCPPTHLLTHSLYPTSSPINYISSPIHFALHVALLTFVQQHHPPLHLRKRPFKQELFVCIVYFKLFIV